MNLPGDQIDVGATRAFTPAAYAVHTAGGRTAFRLDPEFLTDPTRVLPLVATWPLDALDAVSAMFRNELERREKVELGDVLRAIASRVPGPPVLWVKLTTNPNYEEGVYWADTALWLHREDGTETEYEIPDAGPTEDFEALVERFRDLLADYSRADHPLDGAHLVFELESGTFTVTDPRPWG
ncbi:hypothetical protein HFP70_35405 [Streptomyces sp. ARC14]|uniref:hypothetical protein n=1 Tax=Streptomyces sp. ARC14 TaxID=2724152 RepID=UPI003857B0C3